MSPRPMPLALPFFSTTLVGGALLAAPVLAGGTSGITERVSHYPDGSPMILTSVNPAISSDGFVVALETREALLPEDTNGVEDIYVVDRRTGEVRPSSSCCNGWACSHRCASRMQMIFPSAKRRCVLRIRDRRRRGPVADGEPTSG